MKLTEETRKQCDVVFRNRNFMFNIKTKETLSLIIASDIYRSFFVSSLHSPPPIHMSVVGWHSNIWFTHTHTRRENDLAAIWLYTKQCHLQNFVFSHFRRLPSGYNWYQFQYWMITFVVHVRSSRSEYIGMPANMLTDQAYDSGGHSFFKKIYRHWQWKMVQCMHGRLTPLLHIADFSCSHHAQTTQRH